MKVLHCVSSPSAGGVEVYVKDLAKHLIHQGCEPIIAFTGHAKDFNRSTEFEQRYLQELDQFGIKYIFIDKKARKQPWLGMLKIRDYVAEHNITLYHSHLTYGVIYGALLPIKKIYTHHSISPRVNKPLYKILSRFIDEQVGISAICSASLQHYSQRSVTQIDNGVDLNKFPQRSIREISDNVVIKGICVGRVIPDKNYELLIKAVANLPPNLRHRIHIQIAGEGPKDYIAGLQRLVNDRQLCSCIEFIGNRNDIPQLMAQSQLFMMSSLREGLPISLIEATISGLPCLVTDVGGCKEVIDKCGNGWAVAVGDQQDFANKLQYLMTHPEEIARLSCQAIQHGQAYSIANACNKHLQLYREHDEAA